LESKRDDFSSWTYLTVDELEDGKDYYVFITTTGGLYRYDINDVIQVQGRYNATPQFVFLRKGRGMTNITGEKLSVNQVITAFEQVSKETGILASHFRAEADPEKSRYVFRVEFISTQVDLETKKRFAESLDRCLKVLNIEYKAKRDSARLKGPVLHVMHEGWHERERKRQVESGKRAFQVKTELLTPLKAETLVMSPEIETIIELAD
jgi:hypothetical protein